MPKRCSLQWSFALLSVLAFLACAKDNAEPSSTKPIFKTSSGSKLKNSPVVNIKPLQISADGQFNVFQYGQDISIRLSSLALDVDIPKGATVEAWFSTLSTGNVARVAANAFMPNTDLCKELATLKASVRKEYDLPKTCPIAAGRTFQLDRFLDQSFWKGVKKYQNYVVGSSGVLEVRLWDSVPCTVCWKKPTLLVGVSLPFKIVGKKRRKKKKKREKKEKKEKKEKRKRSEM